MPWLRFLSAAPPLLGAALCLAAGVQAAIGGGTSAGVDGGRMIPSVVGSVAATVEVDLELVLAVDISSSMTAPEQVKQREGYATAFRHPEVFAAIADGPRGRIAVAYVAWAGPEDQELVVPWSVIKSPEDAARFSAGVEAMAPRVRRPEAPWRPGTSISEALTFSARLFDQNAIVAPRRTIDISGDGPNNAGAPILIARDAVLAAGVVINGLPLIFGRRTLPIEEYYQNCVIGGPGAFVVTVSDIEDFAVSIRRKLVLEIADLRPQAIAAGFRYAPATSPELCDRWHRDPWDSLHTAEPWRSTP
jgi:hypothetical protein